MEWIQKYIYATYKPEAEALKILDDIDKRQAQYKVTIFGPTYLLNRIAIVPPFAGLRRFPEGRNFKQWTGDDSKALMKVGSNWRLMQLVQELIYLGVSACYTRPCTTRHDTYSWCIPRILLHSTAKFLYRAQLGSVKGCCLIFSSVS